MEGLSEEDKKALRGSKFAPLPPPSRSSSSHSTPRLAHPGGPLKTNKGAALAKFLERKLQDPAALASINPQLLELAVKNAKETIRGGSSSSGRIVQHVNSFGDSEETLEKMDYEPQVHKKKKENKMKGKNKNKKKKNKRQKIVEES
ncbi:Sucrose nonfermenting 4 [Heracleum sosnowskyi]|uniref:Sucrose nonfermenting 4 n=1 Tax=Heracleum sosnowskyi TaxID=360622 RepID=A0AAD8N0L1_9APIA|nr:Sucrose nonfermenting 4 [Heracleum sosnowskyi]